MIVICIVATVFEIKVFLNPTYCGEVLCFTSYHKSTGFMMPLYAYCVCDNSVSRIQCNETRILFILFSTELLTIRRLGLVYLNVGCNYILTMEGNYLLNYYDVFSRWLYFH